MIENYNDFCNCLIKAGFSLGGGNNEGVFSLLEYSWDNTPPDYPINWHTGDIDCDPWEWRMRILEERNDIVYSKVFFSKSGYITKEWYPYFLAVRRENSNFYEEYDSGNISNYAKRIYELIEENKVLPLHAIKKLGGFTKEDKSKFDRALVELQMKLYITMCGSQQKISSIGEEYGWSSTVFCTVEHFWDSEVFEKAKQISKEEAIEKITKQIYLLNSEANEKKIKKFICG